MSTCSYSYADQNKCGRKERLKFADASFCALHYPGDDHIDVFRRDLANELNAAAGKSLDLRGIRLPKIYGTLHLKTYTDIRLSDAIIRSDLVIGTAQYSQLHLDGLQVDGTVIIADVRVAQQINLSRARLGSFEARNTVVGALLAQECEIRGGCKLNASIQDLDFTGARFRGAFEISGDHARVSKAAFKRARFWKGGVIRNAIALTADFSSAIALGTLTLHGSRNVGTALDLNDARIRHLSIDAELSKVSTSPKTRFRARFDLRKCRVTSDLAFAARVGQIACEGATFERTLTLTGTASGFADFGGCVFGSRLSAENYHFRKGVDFSGAEFNGDLVFRGTRFSIAANFAARQLVEEKRAFAGSVTFRGATFDRAIFSGRQFHGSTSFANTTFVEAPSFDECELHKQTILPSAKHFPDTESEFAYRRYQTLRQLCADHGWRIEEGLFHALEERSIRSDKERSRTERAVSYLYDWSSRYGTSFGIPGLWLVGVLIGFGLVYALIDTGVCMRDCEINWSAYGRGFTRSLRNMLVPFIELRESRESPGAGWQIVLASFQSFVSLGFAAVLLLALRWRFRKPA